VTLEALILMLVTGRVPSAAPGAGTSPVQKVDLAAFSAFASSWESNVKTHFPGAMDSYLTEATMLAAGKALRDEVLDAWLAGGEPQTVSSLLGKAQARVPDAGAALLLCHNVCKAFSRGGEEIFWQRTSVATAARMTFPPGSTSRPSGSPVDPLVDYFSDSSHLYNVQAVNAAGKGQILKFRCKDTIFWLLFDKAERFGTSDPGDWYHFFLMATVAYFSATGRATDVAAYGGVRDEVIANIVRAMMHALQSASGAPTTSFLEMTDYDRAWHWCNALSFFEGGFFGDHGANPECPSTLTAAQDVAHESGVHRSGALFGLELAGKHHHPGHLDWWVPRPSRLKEKVTAFIVQYHPMDAIAMRWNADDAPSEKLFWDHVVVWGAGDAALTSFNDWLKARDIAEHSQCRLRGATGSREDIAELDLPAPLAH
jgi:hypothetical protein